MSDHDHGHEHHRFQAHHFETGEQQFQAGKLGMWLFLATEVLFFSGMFCAYTVYRAAHPEVFEDAAHFLNAKLGAANTIVLLASSLSVAWAVRCAQTNNQRGLLANLIVTVTCAGIFMGVKAVEYAIKFKEGLYWRGDFTYSKDVHHDLASTHEMLQTLGWVLLAVGVGLLIAGAVLGAKSIGIRWAFYALGATVLGAAGGCIVGNLYTAYEERSHQVEHAEHGDHDEHEGEHAHDEGDEHVPDQLEIVEETEPMGGPTEPAPTSDNVAGETIPGAVGVVETEPATELNVMYGGEGPKFLGVFFSIYYAMTGVHAIHILAGIGVFVWIISRAARGHFEPDYYGPVEYTGLYWHLVDLIWIYLFPLLYLIQ